MCSFLIYFLTNSTECKLPIHNQWCYTTTTTRCSLLKLTELLESCYFKYHLAIYIFMLLIFIPVNTNYGKLTNDNKLQKTS